MDRKRWIVAALALAVLAAAALVLTKRARFEFLVGQEPVELASTDRFLMQKPHVRYSVYTFSPSTPDFAERVDSELRALGYDRTPTTELGASYARPSLGVANDPSSTEPWDGVMIFKNLRYDKNGLGKVLSQGAGTDSGWVTIVVAEGGSTSMWTQFMRWLGL